MVQNYVQIETYEFDEDLFEKLNVNPFASDYWPVVYILSDDTQREAYIGETTDAFARMSTHLKNKRKRKLSVVKVIASKKFNKSATLDLEATLIKYISSDNSYKLLNGNLGLANHNYYQKHQVYQELFRTVWDRLRSEGFVKHSLEHINNSDLFKYSPYKSLTIDQSKGVLIILSKLVEGKNTILVKGGAGTGKTVLAIFLFKLLYGELDDFNFKEFGGQELEIIPELIKLRRKFPMPKMAIVVPMSSFRSTLKKVFQNIKGLSSKMVIGPSEVVTENFDLLMVDESHRLRRRKNLGAYYGSFDKSCEVLGMNKMSSDELDWVKKQSKQLILFYDSSQSIKPSDVEEHKFTALVEEPTTSIIELKSQFRAKGGNSYVNFISALLNHTVGEKTYKYESSSYDFKLFESIEEMISEIKRKDKEHGLSRMIAGYSWEWKSKKKKEEFDIELEGFKLRWNSTNVDWINSANSINEVGCIHTTQGYDLNYAGIIFGHEIGYDITKEEIIIRKENYHDKNGKQAISDPEKLKKYILNIYKTILLRAIQGTYVYVCDPALRDYFSRHIAMQKDNITGQKSNKTSILRTNDIKPFKNCVPFYDLKIAAGEFSELQISSDQKWADIPENIPINETYFVCQVVGESMNRIIPNGSYCLFRKYSGGSRRGQIALVQSTSLQESEYGSSYTIKEYESKKLIDEEGWEHTTIVLKPCSLDKSFSDLVLEEEELQDFQVVGIFERIIS